MSEYGNRGHAHPHESSNHHAIQDGCRACLRGVFDQPEGEAKAV